MPSPPGSATSVSTTSNAVRSRWASASAPLFASTTWCPRGVSSAETCSQKRGSSSTTRIGPANWGPSLLRHQGLRTTPSKTNVAGPRSSTAERSGATLIASGPPGSTTFTHSPPLTRPSCTAAATVAQAPVPQAWVRPLPRSQTTTRKPSPSSGWHELDVGAVGELLPGLELRAERRREREVGAEEHQVRVAHAHRGALSPPAPGTCAWTKAGPLGPEGRFAASSRAGPIAIAISIRLAAPVADRAAEHARAGLDLERARAGRRRVDEVASPRSAGRCRTSRRCCRRRCAPPSARGARRREHARARRRRPRPGGDRRAARPRPGRGPARWRGGRGPRSRCPAPGTCRSARSRGGL